VNDELKVILKEAGKVIFLNYCGGTEENHDKLRTVGLLDFPDT
jgi:hypothetical protein